MGCQNTVCHLPVIVSMPGYVTIHLSVSIEVFHLARDMKTIYAGCLPVYHSTGPTRHVDLELRSDSKQ